MITKNEKFYGKYLQKYFDKRFKDHECVIEWYPNPSANVWRFYDPIIEAEIVLISNDEGRITEQTRYGKKERLY